MYTSCASSSSSSPILSIEPLSLARSLDLLRPLSTADDMGREGGYSIQWEKTATKMVAGWMGLIQIESSQRTSVEAEGE